MADGQVAAILRALADLAPGDRTDEDVADVTAGDHPFVWLGVETDPSGLFALSDDATVAPPVVPRSPLADHLRGIAALHHEQQVLRFGWSFLCGRAEIGGRPRRVCMPLAFRPVEFRPGSRGDELVGLGEPEVLGAWPGAIPVLDADALQEPTAAEVGEVLEVRNWAVAVARAAGFPPLADVFFPPSGRPDEARLRADLVVVVGGGLYIDKRPPTTARSSSLRVWANLDGIEDTAMAHVYGVGPWHPPGSGNVVDDDAVPMPLPLTAAQLEVVHRSRTQPVTVVSGAPGNGKSHAVCAAAVDAVAQGRSVLVATPTAHAADVLGELLARQPSPQPVHFGETEGRRRMIGLLETIGQSTVGDAELQRRRALVDAARSARASAETLVRGALAREVGAARAARWTPKLPELRVAAPGAFAPGADLAGAGALLRRCGDWPRWWHRRRLRSTVGSTGGVPVELIAEALLAAGDIRSELELETMGGTTIGTAWDSLLAAEAAEAAAEGSLAAGLAIAGSRWSAAGRRAVAALVGALPAGRAARRNLLVAVDAVSLVDVLPLWVGTLRDVDELLPPRPGMFDLVIIDEAAQVDQFRAAGALLRARAAVVVGDPRQLRHVSFVADDDVAEVVAAAGVDGLADRLDVRRQAIYDVAAGAAPVTFLDEHHRSVPHLIEFSNRRFYDGRIRVATRNPSNEVQDVIGVVRVDSVVAEVGASVDRVAELVGHGFRSIGVFTPFRAHADAIEAALLERFPPEELREHGIRAGTAHSAQGSERDHVVVALGLAVDDPAGRWRFAEDPNLFNVLVTRARRQLTVVTALPEGHDRPGILTDYLRHAASAPTPPAGVAPRSPWIADLAAELVRNGVACRTGYPVGRWEVDIVTGTGSGAVALDCEVHTDGPDAHMDRHRALRLAGWRTLDAFASRWDGDAASAAVELSGALRDPG